jgi:hypothetical protein
MGIEQQADQKAISTKLFKKRKCSIMVYTI